MCYEIFFVGHLMMLWMRSIDLSSTSCRSINSESSAKNGISRTLIEHFVELLNLRRFLTATKQRKTENFLIHSTNKILFQFLFFFLRNSFIKITLNQLSRMDLCEVSFSLFFFVEFLRKNFNSPATSFELQMMQ